jgi:PhnB protein
MEVHPACKRVKAIPEGMHTITPHIVVRNAARAAEWYAEALGAEERSRIPLPGGKLMSVELWFGDSAVMVADEFPEMGVLSPESVGGTSTVLNLYTEDVDAVWERAVGAGAEVLYPLGETFLGDRHGQISDPFGHRWGSHSTCVTSRPRRSSARQPRRSAVRLLTRSWVHDLVTAQTPS